jgi:hypothetical protein
MDYRSSSFLISKSLLENDNLRRLPYFLIGICLLDILVYVLYPKLVFYTDP